jgi:hypothetical protein
MTALSIVHRHSFIDANPVSHVRQYYGSDSHLWQVKSKKLKFKKEIAAVAALLRNDKDIHNTHHAIQYESQITNHNRRWTVDEG